MKKLLVLSAFAVLSITACTTWLHLGPRDNRDQQRQDQNDHQYDHQYDQQHGQQHGHN
jgi:outer membrane biogenesis lipoprotein LolB